MLVPVLFIWLFTIWGVHANIYAAPFEILYYYTAYKIEWRSGIQPRRFATGCTHTPDAAFDHAAEAVGVKGICTIEEFVRHVGSQGDWHTFKAAGSSRGLEPSDKAFKAEFDAHWYKVEPKRNWNLNLAHWIPSFNSPPGFGGTPDLGPVLDHTNEIIQDARATEQGLGDDVLQDWLDKDAKYAQVAMQYRIKEQARRTRILFRTCMPEIAWAQEEFIGAKYQTELNINYLDGTNIRQPSPAGQGPGTQDRYAIFKTDELAKIDGALADFRKGMRQLRKGEEWVRERTDIKGVKVSSNKGTKNPNGVSKGHVHNIDAFRTAITILRAPPPPACDVFSRRKR